MGRALFSLSIEELKVEVGRDVRQNGCPNWTHPHNECPILNFGYAGCALWGGVMALWEKF